MNDAGQPKTDRERQLDGVIAEYLRRAANGEDVDRERLIANFPHLADELRTFFESGDLTVSPADGKNDADASPVGLETLPPNPLSESVAEHRQATNVTMPEHFGKYEIVKVLGRGAMGVVYLANDPQLRRMVALKIPTLTAGESEESLRRFFREGKAAAGLNHPNICAVYEVDQVGDTHYIAMQYIEGNALSNYVNSSRPMDERNATLIVRKLAQALSHAHGRGIIHRDLKPSNVMMDHRRQPILTDFGLARRLNSVESVRMTQSGMLLGTPAYMSPEQVEGKLDTVGAASDIYSLGVIFYELLTGRLPFQGPLATILAQIAVKDPEKPSLLRPDLDGRLEAICLRMMSKPIGKRFASMNEVAEALAQVLKTPNERSKADANTGIRQTLTGSKRTTVLTAGDAQAVYRAACKCHASHDYEQAASMLQEVPERFRDHQIEALLEEATEKNDEVNFLLAALEDAESRQDYDRLLPCVERLLELKPGHRQAFAIYSKLSSRRSASTSSRRANQTKAQRAGIYSTWPILAGAAALVVVIAAVLLVSGRTGNVLVPVVIDESVRAAGVSVRIDGKKTPVATIGKTISLAPGPHELEIVRGNQIVKTQNFEVLRHRNDPLSITLADDVLPSNIASSTTKHGSHPRQIANGPSIVDPGPALEPKPAIAPFDAEQAKRHQEEWAAYANVPVEYENSIGMKFRLIPPGQFQMGSTQEEIDAALKQFDPTEKWWAQSVITERPRHKVVLTKPIYVGIYEVTQKDYEAITHKNPSYFAKSGSKPELSVRVQNLETARHPVENVTWHDATAFCTMLSQQESLSPCYSTDAESAVLLDGTGYRLPSEAEWEFFCRAGTTTKYWVGDQDRDLLRAGLFFHNSGGRTYNLDANDGLSTNRFAAGGRTHGVGELNANPFGLYDLHGNVWEWVEDWWDSSYYDRHSQQPAIDPRGPTSGNDRVERGGGWFSVPAACRSADRTQCPPTVQTWDLGFRVVLSIDAVKQKLKTGASSDQSATSTSADRSNAAQTNNPAADQPALLMAPFDEAAARNAQSAWAASLKTPEEITNSIGMKLRLIPPGDFLMGANDSGKPANNNEKPRHRVQITHAFHLGTHEVTRGQFAAFVRASQYKSQAEKDGKGGYGVDLLAKQPVEGPKYTWRDAGFTQNDDHPAINVSWNDAVAFCKWLSKQEGKTYRLPTEAEWEYACRAGTTTVYSIGDDPEDLAKIANVADRLFKQQKPTGLDFGIDADDRHLFTASVGSFQPNNFGLFDMHGNVWDWCADWYEEKYYAHSPVIDPQGPSAGSLRVMRGGGWGSAPDNCRTSRRYEISPDYRDYCVGFRVVCEVAAADSDNASKTATPTSNVEPTNTNPAAASPVALEAPFDEAAAKRAQAEWAASLHAPEEFANSIGMKFRLIPSGEFSMGNSEQSERIAEIFLLGTEAKSATYSDEFPHRVKITQPFYLGTYEVTRGQFSEFVRDLRYKTDAEKDDKGGCGFDKSTGTVDVYDRKYSWRNLGFPQTDEHPVVNVSWNDAVAFCEWLGSKEGKTYRLPTEAEREYAGRAGTTTLFYNGDDPEGLARIGNVGDGTLKETLPDWTNATIRAKDGSVFTSTVGRYQPNNFGLFDMHGNVYEWCHDWHGLDYYNSSPSADPRGPTAGISRVMRGSGWRSRPVNTRASSRRAHPPDYRDNYVGFRVVCESTVPNSDHAAQTSTPTSDAEPANKDSAVPSPALLMAPFDEAAARNGQSAWAASLRAPEEFANSIGMKFRLIPPGEFRMGAADNDNNAGADEKPQHRVRIVKPFFLAVHEVTVGQFGQFVSGSRYKTEAEKDGTGAWGYDKLTKTVRPDPKYNWRNTGFSQTDEHPVVNVSWNDVNAFSQWLSDRERKTYRLPTEAEWEYACRAGTTTAFHFGTELNGEKANVNGNNPYGTNRKGPYLERTRTVGSYAANAFGLFDMHGNMAEWCQDWYVQNYYATSPTDDPRGPIAGSSRVLRGGGWNSQPGYSRSSSRFQITPNSRFLNVGFRVMCESPVAN